MTCKHCCDADSFFDLKVAKKDLKKYQKNGTRGATKKIEEFLGSFELEGWSLLDIGGGIGALQWNHLSKKGSKTTDADASSGYIEVAKSFAKEKGWETRTSFIQGDFMDVEGVEPHDVVTLDKVVCCYPDFRILLEKSIRHCNSVLALSYPMGGIISRIIVGLGNLFMKLKGSSFRPYVHPPKEIQNFIESHGYALKKNGRSFPMLVELYQKQS